MAEATGGSFYTRMRALNDGIIQSGLDQLSMYGLVMEFWSATASSPGREHFKAAFQEGYRELKVVIGDIIRKAQDAGEVSDDVDNAKVAAGLIGTWDALLLQAWLDPEFDALATARAFLDLVLRGLETKT
jgi:hypothetical protein